MPKWHPERLRKEMTAVKTIIDVGVNAGTNDLYEAFPECFHLLVEPTPCRRDDIQEILRTYRGELVQCAAGATDGKGLIHVYRNSGLNTLLNRTPITQHETVETTVEVDIRTLDAIVAQRSLEKPYGIKVDTEGYEVEVLRGATATLRDTQFVIAEVSVAERFENAYDFCEFVGMMKRCGFVLHDILDLRYCRIARDGTAWNGTSFVNAYFIKQSLRPTYG